MKSIGNTAVAITILLTATGLAGTALARDRIHPGASPAPGLAIAGHLLAHDRHGVHEHRYHRRAHGYGHGRHFSGSRHRYQRGIPGHLGKPRYRYHGKHAPYRALRHRYRLHGHYRDHAHRYRHRGYHHSGYRISIEYGGLRYHISGSGHR